ncbi:MAG: SUMF1/EgtB/PvdO family nonheme iron enzyme [Acidimicrobiales bacterium]|nr:SUMF1/EgtB/PvdO family nonheme iron enzyme [Acidimicrobiales bacterium]
MTAWLDLPTGRFTMGSNDFVGQPDDDEGPTREVTVGAFRLSAEPVTVGEFAAFVDASAYETTAEREGSGFVGRFPDLELVEGASWRRPNGPSSEVVPTSPVTQVSWSDAFEYCLWSHGALPSEAQWAYASSLAADGDAPIHGELWQWCADYYDESFFRREQRVNPTGPNGGSLRVARGGSDRRTARAALYPDFGSSDLTFRVVKT